MKVKSKEEKQAVRYLLGDLNEAEQTRLEERSFSDAEFSNLLSDVENDLVDEYIRGELSALKRERFEHIYMVSERRRQKVEIARSLLKMEVAPAASYAADASQAPPRWWKTLFDPQRAARPPLSYAFATAALIFLLGGVWLFSEIRQLRKEVTQLETDRDSRARQYERLRQQTIERSQQNDKLAAEKEDLRQEMDSLRQQAEMAKAGRHSAPAFLTFILSPGYRSSEGPKNLSVPPAISIVRVQLKLNPGDDYLRYEARLQTTGGDHVRSWSGLRVRSVSGEPAVFINIPASLLKPGQYELTLKGITGPGQNDILGYYYFNKN